MQYMKYIAHIVLLLGVLILLPKAALAQRSLRADQLPFMPARDTTGIHTRVEYRLSDVVMGKRTAQNTVHYDRHGYETSPLIKLAFDSAGRLTDRMVQEERFVVSVQASVEEPVEIDHVVYSSEGLVNYYSSLHISRHAAADPDTTLETYRLIGQEVHPVYGITKLVYRHGVTSAPASVYDILPTSYYDTLVLGRVFDAKGRLIQQYCEGSQGGTFDYQHYYYYDEHGRLAYRKSLEYEYADSVGYTYNIMNNVIGYSGKCYGEGDEGDIIVSLRPNWKPTTRSEIWFLEQFDEVSEEWMPVQSVYRTYYDKRGNISRRETPDYPVIEYDYVYWDEIGN